MLNGALARFDGNWFPGGVGSVANAAPLRSTWVAEAAWERPFAPGNSPYRLSKLWFSRYMTTTCLSRSKPGTVPRRAAGPAAAVGDRTALAAGNRVSAGSVGGVEARSQS